MPLPVHVPPANPLATSAATGRAKLPQSGGAAAWAFAECVAVPVVEDWDRG